MEATITTRVSLEETDGNWTAKLTRLKEDESYMIGTLTDLTPSQVYVAFGIKLPEPVEKATTAIERAREALTNSLASLGSGVVFSREVVENLLLDPLNELGYPETKEPEEE